MVGNQVNNHKFFTVHAISPSLFNLGTINISVQNLIETHQTVAELQSGAEDVHCCPCRFGSNAVKKHFSSLGFFCLFFRIKQLFEPIILACGGGFEKDLVPWRHRCLSVLLFLWRDVQK